MMRASSPPKVTPDRVRRVLDNPPPFVERCYLAGYRSRRFSLEGLAGGVVAALGMSPYDDDAVGAVLEILCALGYGDEPADTLFV